MKYKLSSAETFANPRVYGHYLGTPSFGHWDGQDEKIGGDFFTEGISSAPREGATKFDLT